jgi:hypothetical protein
LKLREYMTENGIPYKKAVVFDSEAEAELFMLEQGLSGRIFSMVFAS